MFSFELSAVISEVFIATLSMYWIGGKRTESPLLFFKSFKNLTERTNPYSK